MSAISNPFRSYYNQIPHETGETAAKAFGYSVAAAVIIGVVANPGVAFPALLTTGIRTGVVAALATLVHSAMAPLIRDLGFTSLPLPLEAARRAVEWCLTTAIASMHPAFRINILATVILGTVYMLVSAARYDQWDYPVSQAAMMFPLLETVMDNRHYTSDHWR